MGRGREHRRAEGGRARDAEARLGLRAACLARPVGLAGGVPQESARRVGDSGDHSVLEYREGVSPACARYSASSRITLIKADLPSNPMPGSSGILMVLFSTRTLSGKPP